MIHVSTCNTKNIVTASGETLKVRTTGDATVGVQTKRGNTVQLRIADVLCVPGLAKHTRLLSVSAILQKDSENSVVFGSNPHIHLRGADIPLEVIGNSYYLVPAGSGDSRVEMTRNSMLENVEPDRVLETDTFVETDTMNTTMIDTFVETDTMTTGIDKVNTVETEPNTSENDTMETGGAALAKGTFDSMNSNEVIATVGVVAVDTMSRRLFAKMNDQRWLDRDK